ncbi:sensor domain-containing protein [Amycolatopsis sp. SID8362]|uniref:sensor domain-containing protein n=1 Tax=Amycolatopsis sp. SID8362 TaxID=2690346 RepID=UPI00136B88C1|nr:sensor domain-containing protein [Amycolatopsis sp. SID8362]NBH06661.1 two-component system sensor kinase [Amycolatopsis sp. SID8362]NED43358.1 two-component system sensor kinase [Amycolatopsis sp. SID8362]
MVRERRDPPFGGSVVFLLMNLPLGVVAFALLTSFTAAGVGTAVVWVGVGLLAVLVLAVRGGARLERARVYALLDRYIDLPYLPLPAEGQKNRWKARLKDPSTWRDLAYFFVLFPLGLVEFVLVTVFWSTSLALAGLPIYFRWLPGGAYYFPADDVRWLTVDSTVEALPWAALGVLFIALSVALTKALAGVHARLANALLGPTVAQRRRMERWWEDAEEKNLVAG